MFLSFEIQRGIMYLTNLKIDRKITPIDKCFVHLPCGGVYSNRIVTDPFSMMVPRCHSWSLGSYWTDKRLNDELGGIAMRLP